MSFTNRLGRPSMIVPGYLTPIYFFNQSLTFNQTFSPINVHIYSFNQSLSFNQTLSNINVHIYSIISNLLFNQTISKTGIYNHILPNDILNFIQTITYNNSSSLTFLASSKQSFTITTSFKLTIFNFNSVNHYSIVSLYTYTFTLPFKDLLPFKKFLNYNQFDPFIINDRISYLRQDNADALNLFNNNPNICLKFDVIDG